MGLMMLRPILMASSLDTTGFATYSAGLLVSSTFCMLGCLGLQPMLQRKMPMDLVAGKELASMVLLVQGIIIAVSCAALVSSFALSDWSLAGLSPENLVISLLHGLSQQLFVLATVESRSRGEPLRFSAQSLVRATLVVTGAGLVAWYTRSPSAALLVEATLSTLIAWRITARVLPSRLRRQSFLFKLAVRRMSKIGWREALALMAVMVVGFSLANADRWFAASWLSPAHFAWYAFAWVLMAASQSVQAIVNSSIYPSLARRYAQYGRSSSYGLAARVSVLFLVLLMALVWPGYFLLKILISNWFVDYTPSLQVIPIFLAVAAVRVSDFWSSHLVIIGRERLLLLINLVVGSSVLVTWVGFSRSDVVGGVTLLHLSWLAVALTITNYLAVAIAAFHFRR